MNREIKFRAWSRATKKMSDWDFIHSVRNLHKLITLNHIDLMQYTGLKDKNGVEIYEGDFLIDEYPVDDEDLSLGYNKSFLPVVWCNNQLMWCVDVSFNKNKTCLTSLIDYFGEFAEVVGNIYETPELLQDAN